MSRAWSRIDICPGPSRTPRWPNSLVRSSTRPHGTGLKSEWPTDSFRARKPVQAVDLSRANLICRPGPIRVGPVAWLSTVISTQPSISLVGNPKSPLSRNERNLRTPCFSPQPDQQRICTAKHAGRADRHPHNRHGNVMRALGRNRVLRSKSVWDVGR
jgi:hypothetical protein